MSGPPDAIGVRSNPLRVPGAWSRIVNRREGLVSEPVTRRQAMRYPIAARMLFRGQGESPWRFGETITVSCSGVLFRADGALPGPDASLDFILIMPVSCDAPPCLRCRGHVVRIAPGTLACGSHVAVSIDAYALGRAGPGLTWRPGAAPFGDKTGRFTSTGVLRRTGPTGH